MPSVLNWHATTKGGRAVVRGDGHPEKEYREMVVETDHPETRVVRLVVDPRRDENLRAFTRRHQRQTQEGVVTGMDAVPVLEVQTRSGDLVRLYLYENEVVLTTADLYR